MGKTKTKNRYNNTNIYFQGFTASINAKKYVKSKFYRKELESLVGYTAVIKGEVGDIRTFQVQKRTYNRFLLKNVHVLQARNKPANIKVEHIWIICERGFLHRNHVNIGDITAMNGSFYEYKKYDCYGNPLRNIGFNMKSLCSKADLEIIESEMNFI